MHRIASALAVAATLAVATPRAQAADGKPLQLSLVDPIQIVPSREGISGFGFNLIYGKNAFLHGAELGIANHVTGDVKGVQLGLVNITGGSFVGWQAGAVNITSGSFEGFQSAWIVSTAKSVSGVQFSLVNHAEHVHGLQLGLVNHTVTMNGIQIGLVNIIERGGWLPVCVIVNGSL
jgi:hypothetical protein